MDETIFWIAVGLAIVAIAALFAAVISAAIVYKGFPYLSARTGIPEQVLVPWATDVISVFYVVMLIVHLASWMELVIWTTAFGTAKWLGDIEFANLLRCALFAALLYVALREEIISLSVPAMVVILPGRRFGAPRF
jgi:hypothetical protein